MNLIQTKISSVALLVAVAGAALSAPVNAQAQPAPTCPVGYWQFNTVYSNAKGDVHSAGGMTAQAIAGKHGGQARDWKLGALCMQTAGGDIHIFDAPTSDRKSASR